MPTSAPKISSTSTNSARHLRPKAWDRLASSGMRSFTITLFLHFFQPINVPSPTIRVIAMASSAFLAPDRSAPYRLAPDRLAPYRSAPDRLAPDRFAPDRLAPDRSAPDRSAPDRSAPDSLATDRSAPDRSAPYRLAPDRLAPDRSALDRLALEASAASSAARTCIPLSMPSGTSNVNRI